MNPRGPIAVTPVGLVLGVAGASGAAAMTLELAAVRLLAPWFGTSSTVWTNVIGVVLLGLALGYLLGSFLSARHDPRAVLARLLLIGALCVAWLPALAAPVAGAFLPGGLALEQAVDLLRWGSLATAGVLFLPGTLLLGCVSPLCAELLERGDRGSAGAAGGRVLASSTLGSLLGTFGTTYLFLPTLGLAHTFLAAGIVIGLCGAALVWGKPAPRGLLLLAFGGLVLCAALAVLRRPPLPGGARLLAEAESPYQSVRVAEMGTGAERLRFLQVNEGFDSFQSVWRPEPGLLPEGYYYNLFALPPWWSKARGRWRLLVLGLGAGSTWRVLEGTLPPHVELEARGVEIDPMVTALGAQWMDLAGDRSGRQVLSGMDARFALNHMQGTFDQIVLDAYQNQVEIPAHLASEEFFAELSPHIAPGGWVCANVGGFDLDDPLVQALGRALARGLKSRVFALRVPFSRNCVLFAGPGIELFDPSQPWSISTLPELEHLAQALQLPGAGKWINPSGQGELGDDTNPIDRLQAASIERAALRARERP